MKAKTTVGFFLVLVLFTGCANNVGGSRVDGRSGEMARLLDEAASAYQEGRLDEAEQHLNQIVSRDRTVAEAWFLLGNVHYRNARLEAAVTAYEKTLRFDSTNDNAWHNLALTRVKQAIDVAERGLEELPADSAGRSRLLRLRRELTLEQGE